MNVPRIIAFAGSLRTDSYNKQLVQLAASAARALSAEVTVIDLRNLALPIFDEDLEKASGMPPEAKKFKTLLQNSDGFLIASPEYNSSITAALKNAIDWASRSEGESEPPLIAFRGKIAALFSASPGALGGLRGLVHLRAILSNIGVMVLPNSVTISSAHEAFTEEGGLKDKRKSQQVTDLTSELVKVVTRLRD